MNLPGALSHPRVSRRTAVQAGALGLLGLGMNHLEQLRAAPAPAGKAKSCIYIFLSGGLSQHDSFDLKPDAPAGIRGDFRPILSIASRKSCRSSALAIASSFAPISSTPWRASAPLFASAIAVLSAVCPPIVGSSASGFSRAMIFSTISGVIGST